MANNKTLADFGFKAKDLLNDHNTKIKVIEKRQSATTRFNFYLALQAQARHNAGLEVGLTRFEDMTFEDSNSGRYIGEFADYLATTSRKYCKADSELVKYATAVNYMSAIKIMLIIKFKNVGVPLQLQTEVWKRYLETMRSVKWEESRKKQNRMIGHKEAATEEDKMGSDC